MLRIICFLFTFQIFSCYAQITQVETMQEAMHYFDQADSETLAIFDIDLVLLQPSDPAFQMPNINVHKEIAKKIFLSLSHEQQDVLLTLMALSTNSILVDRKTPCYLHQFALKGIPTIALTSNLTGGLGDVPSLESWKEARLHQVGIDFSSTSPIKMNYTFCDLPSYRGYHSAYFNGILFANGDVCPKGDVLVSYLSWGSLSPKRIIFIDDRIGNLENVEKALQAYDASIIFEGIHYTGAANYPSKEISSELFRAKWEELAQQAMHLAEEA